MSFLATDLRWKLGGVVLVFLVYFYFLIFTQFTFLHLLEGRFDSPFRVKGVLAVMAGCGILGGVLAVRLHRRVRPGAAFTPALLVCALVAAVAPYASGPAAFATLAGSMGLSMGWLTVAVAGQLPVLIPEPARGLRVGVATGLAYAASNVPFLFHSAAETRAWVCAGVLVVGALILGISGGPFPAEETSGGEDHPRLNGWLWVVTAFIGLIAFDSAVFYRIQENRALQSLSWGADGQLWTNAVVHFGAAVVAGWCFDRHGPRRLLHLAGACLLAGAVGVLLLRSAWTTSIYVGGVSVYSCLLVLLPSSGAGQPSLHASMVRAAWIYGAAGWVGSGLGIGAAEHPDRFGFALIIFAAAFVAGTLGLEKART